MAKRLFDVVASLAGLALLWPVLLLIAVVVRLDSPGPALFRQERVGRFGRPFWLLKFRSMAATPMASGPLLTAGRDPRITRAGHWLRATKLDELPQLVNVLKGDMSLVGPRPEVAKYVALYPDDVRDVILSVRPGITDEAAIRFRNESELLGAAADPERYYIEEILPGKLALYVDYARRATLRGDVGLILRTLAALLPGSGSRSR